MTCLRACVRAAYIGAFSRREFRIDGEKLASYERKVVTQPHMPFCDIGSLIYDFRQYLEILKDVHDCLDLQVNKDAARTHAADTSFRPHSTLCRNL